MPSVLEIKQSLIEKEKVLNKLLDKADQLIDRVEAKEKAIDALDWATQTGRLDLASILLATVSVIVAVAAVIGYIEIRSKAAKEAKAESKVATQHHLKVNGVVMLKECLSDPEVAATLQATIAELGLTSTNSATSDNFAAEEGDGNG